LSRTPKEICSKDFFDPSKRNECDHTLEGGEPNSALNINSKMHRDICLLKLKIIQIAFCNGYIPEHVLEMSRLLNRPLSKDEVVHHINYDKLDNKPNNLFLYKNKGEHLRACSSLHKLVKSLLLLGIIYFENGEYKLKEGCP